MSQNLSIVSAQSGSTISHTTINNPLAPVCAPPGVVLPQLHLRGPRPRPAKPVFTRSKPYVLPPVEHIIVSRPAVSHDLLRTILVKTKDSTFAVKLTIFSTADLYKYVDKRINVWLADMPWSCKYKVLQGTAYFNAKPLSRRAIALAEYGIQNNDSIVFELHLAFGGFNPLSSVIRQQVQGFNAIDYISDQLFNTATNYIGEHKDRIALIMEATIVLFKSLYISTTFEQSYLACISYLHVVKGKTVVKFVSEVYTTIKSLLSSFFDNTTLLQSEEKYENPFSMFRQCFKYMEEGKSHPLIVKLKTIINYLLAHAFLEPFGITFSTFNFNKASAEACQIKYSSKLGFAHALLDGFSYVFERLYDVYKTGSWNSIIHSGRSYGKWIDTVYQIKEDSLKLHNPDATGINYHQYLASIDTCIEQGEVIVAYIRSSADGAEVSVVKRLLAEIRIIKANECTRKAAQQERRSPYAVLLYGGSSVGKSSVAKILFNHFAKVHNLPCESEYRYIRCFTDEYWSGFRSSNWYIQLDDIAARNKNLQDDDSTSEVLQIINNVPYTPPQADLADKGKTPLKPELVIGTTNTCDLNASIYYGNPLAILRRFPLHVTVIPKKEYSKNEEDKVDLRMLDVTKIPQAKSGEYPDLWNFRLSRAIPTMRLGKQSGEIRQFGFIDNIDDFLSYYARESILHRDQQIESMNSDKEFETLSICDKCYRNLLKCNCDITNHVQSCEENVAYKSFMTLFVMIIGTLYIFLKQGIISFSISHQLKKLERKILYTVLETVREEISLNSYSAYEKLQVEKIKIKEYMIQVGDSIRNKMESNKLTLAAIAAVPVVIGMYKVYNMFSNLDMQGGISSKIGERIDNKDEKENPWFRDDYEPSQFDVGRLSSSWKSLNNEDIIKTVSKNCVAIIAHYERDNDIKMRPGKAFCIGGQCYVTNLHNLHTTDMTIEVISGPTLQGLSQNLKFFLSYKKIIVDESNDLAFFEIPCLPPKKNLINLFPSSLYKTECNGMLLKRTCQGIITRLNMSGMYLQKNCVIVDLKKTITSWRSTVPDNTISGDCGSIVLGFTPNGPMLLGIHQTGGKDFQTTAIALNREYLEKKLQDLVLFSSGKPDLSDVQGEEIQLDIIHPKSVFRYIDNGICHVYGSFSGYRPKHTSKVTETFICQSAIKHGYEVKTDKPVMKGWEPWRLGAVDIVQQKFMMDGSILDQCISSFTNDILSALPKNQFKELVILDNASTLNGLPGVKFIDKMNRNTSMGFPWKTKKSRYLTYLGDHDIWQDCVEFDDAFYKRVDNIIDNYHNSERHMPVFTAHLKDEPTAFSKIEAHKTRVFAGGPADWSFVVRKYLLSFVRVLQNNKFIFEAAPGTNSTSMEWDQLYHYLTKHGKDRIVAGDYSKFDKNMSSQIILAAFKIIKNILYKAGWNDNDIKIIDGISFDTAFPLIDYNGDLVEFFGSNPSGHPLTVIINSLVNSLYVRYCWAIVGNDLSTFKQHVNLMTYGDDNIMGISNNINNFDHTIMQKALSTFNVKYTMADKEAISVPFINIKDASFLKRRFVFDKDIGCVIAQLEEDSIHKMLTKCIPSKTICMEAHSIQVIQCALREYFNYGKDIFEQKKIVMNSIIDECKIRSFLHQELPEWSVLKQAFFENSLHISQDGICDICEQGL